MGAHYGLSLKLKADPKGILLSASPTNVAEEHHRLCSGRPIPKEEGEIERQQERENEIARSIVTQSDNRKAWCECFLATPLDQDTVDENDEAQAAVLRYAGKMGIPSEGHALTSNFQMWGNTLSTYIHAKCQAELPPQGEMLGSLPPSCSP